VIGWPRTVGCACAVALACATVGAFGCGKRGAGLSGGSSSSSDDGGGDGDRGSDRGALVNRPATPRVKMISPDIRSLPEPRITLPLVESFRLLDAGAAPRAPLRYTWDAKANRALVVEASLRSRRLADGTWSDALAVAPVREGLGFITQPTTGGAATLSFRGLIGEVGASSDAAARARAEEYLSGFRTLIEHRRGTATIDDRGQLSGLVFADAAADAGTRDRAVDETLQRWIAAAVPLPAEPIGKGARWRVATVLRAGPGVIKQTAEYTLVEARPDRWVIDTDVRRIGEDQLVSAAGLPDGSVAELIALFRENQGRVELSPSLPWPIAGTVTTELRVHLRLGVPGEPVHEEMTEDLGTLTFSVK
jgi:hypothetical protein